MVNIVLAIKCYFQRALSLDPLPLKPHTFLPVLTLLAWGFEILNWSNCIDIESNYLILRIKGRFRDSLSCTRHSNTWNLQESGTQWLRSQIKSSLKITFCCFIIFSPRKALIINNSANFGRAKTSFKSHIYCLDENQNKTQQAFLMVPWLCFKILKSEKDLNTMVNILHDCHQYYYCPGLKCCPPPVSSTGVFRLGDSSCSWVYCSCRIKELIL